MTAADTLRAAGWAPVTLKGCPGGVWGKGGRIWSEAEALRQVEAEAAATSLGEFRCLLRVTEVRPDGVALAELVTCPGCHRPLDGRGRCWRCSFRRCACGRDTGSAFIELCLHCQAKEERK